MPRPNLTKNKNWRQPYWGRKPLPWDPQWKKNESFQMLCEAASLDWRDGLQPEETEEEKAERQEQAKQMFMRVITILGEHQGLKNSLDKIPRPESRRHELQELERSLRDSHAHLNDLSRIAKQDFVYRECSLLNRPEEIPADVFVKSMERQAQYDELTFQIENMLVSITQTIQHLNQTSPGSTKDPKLTDRIIIRQLKEVFDHYSDQRNRSEYYRQSLNEFLKAAYACAGISCPKNLTPYL